MKNIYKLMIMMTLGCLYSMGYAQQNIGIGTTNPHQSAVLDIRSKTRGLLIPIVDKDQRDAIKSIAKIGLLVYDSAGHQFVFFDGANWTVLNQLIKSGSPLSGTVPVAASHDGALSITGNFSSNAVNTGVVTASSINSSGNISGNNITATGTITAPNYALNATGNGPIPQGGIIMWSGTLGNIPAGWHLCDGTAGTPDLRSKFVMGAGFESDHNPGGANSLTLNTNQIPSHTHTVLGQSGGDNNDNNNEARFAGGDKGPTESGFFFSTESQATGGGQSFDNRPAYLALAYIMKL
jgi:hypothetical protein